MWPGEPVIVRVVGVDGFKEELYRGFVPCGHLPLLATVLLWSQ